MTSRKCCINGCTSQEGEEKDAGVTFHRFPQNVLQTEKWINGRKKTKHHFIIFRYIYFVFNS